MKGYLKNNLVSFFFRTQRKKCVPFKFKSGCFKQLKINIKSWNTKLCFAQSGLRIEVEITEYEGTMYLHTEIYNSNIPIKSLST